MKINIKRNSVNFEELKTAVVNRFPEYTFWELPGKRLLAQKNKFIGCYISLYKRSIVVIGTFPSIKKTVLALVLTILGGIFIPLIVYYIFFYDEFKYIENKIGEFIKERFSDRLRN